jgi:hypothetical protein
VRVVRNRLGPLTGGLGPVTNFLSISNSAQISKFKMEAFPCSKNIKTLDAILIFRTIFSIGSTSNSQKNSQNELWNIIQFESSMNFKGLQPSREKSSKFSKILSQQDL